MLSGTADSQITTVEGAAQKKVVIAREDNNNNIIANRFSCTIVPLMA